MFAHAFSPRRLPDVRVVWPLRRGRAVGLVIAGVAALTQPATAATGVVGATPTPTPAPTPTPTPLAVDAPGSYRVWMCRTPSGAPAPTDGWTPSPTTAGFSVAAGCQAGGAFGIVANGLGVYGGELEWKAATGVSAVRARLWRTASATTDKLYVDLGGALARLTARSYTPTSGGLQQSETALDDVSALFTLSASVGQPSAPISPGNVREISPVSASAQENGFPALVASARCFGPALTSTCDANYLIWRADFDMVDRAAPTGATTGALAAALGAPADRTVSGALAWTASIADAGSGAYRAHLEVDDVRTASAVVAGAPATCAPATASDGARAFTAQRACAAEGAASGVLDTAALTDGRHRVRVLYEDAAGNVTVGVAGEVVVKNASTVGVGSPLELRGAVNGSPAADAAVLRVNWPGTARKASTRASTVRRCKDASYAKRHPLQCAGRPALSGAEFAWSPSEQLAGQLQLADPEGRPIAGATVELIASPMATASAPASLGTVTTDAGGQASFTVALADGSRTVEARWKARMLDTRPAAIGTATVMVRASTSLQAPRRVRPGRRVTFSGRLDGRAGSLAKVPVQLEVRDGGRWKTFATSSTDGAGMWATTLRFARTPGRYTVRARVGTTTTYPYADGSGQRLITIAVR